MVEVSFLDVHDDAWSQAFAQLPLERRDMFYSQGFAKLCQRTLNVHDRVVCAVAHTQEGPILYPFAVRDLERIAGTVASGLKDMTGLYGRNGLACSAAVASAELEDFHAQVASFARSNGVICAFDRFHPVMDNAALAAPETRVIQTGNFVTLDLGPAIETIEAGYKYSLRKELRKGEANGVRVFLERGADHIAAFDSIYRHTMDRNSAGEFYYFGESFLALAVELLGDDAFFAFAEAGGEIVSCEMVLTHGLYGHSFIGGTLRSALRLSANHLLKREVIRELKRRGCRHFLLGAGTQPDDGIERYKRAFAPEGGGQSLIGGTVYDAPAMELLRTRLVEAGGPMSPGRFQFYDMS
jgi:CelD/BcsL family acetyltransferase involved in cellulose biosynthesis